MEQFREKVALVTGGGSGIGQATAIEFARKGAKVVVANRNEAMGHATVRLIQEIGGTAVFIKTDITDEDNVKNLLEQTVEIYGRLDFAFNNAGVSQDPGPVDLQTADEFDRILNTNVKGVWLCMKYQLPELVKTKGAIVNTASMAGVVGFAGAAAYTASKHAVIGLTKSFALEYAEAGVRINSIAPGFIDTGMFDEVGGSDDLKKEFANQVPLKRWGQAKEIADTVIYLCSSASSFVTGHTLIADGGYTVG
ncbi:SDR family oxidoreductase [Daejeonia sp. YH14]|uniref:SDR family oxidoreductase n=1 Tax=Daejeonia sp. YH14 TaxID=3439042 RepID=UPI003F495783